jgi:hypothetical protein
LRTGSARWSSHRKFERPRLPRARYQARYQYGGVASTAPPRTVDLIPELAQWSRDAAAMFRSPEAREAPGLADAR